MSVSNPVALDFLLTRRSHPVKTLDLPVPDTAELTTLLTAAARCPDHGKLEPWRFIVLQKPALGGSIPVKILSPFALIVIACFTEMIPQ